MHIIIIIIIIIIIKSPALSLAHNPLHPALPIPLMLTRQFYCASFRRHSKFDAGKGKALGTRLCLLYKKSGNGRKRNQQCGQQEKAGASGVKILGWTPFPSSDIKTLFLTGMNE